MGKLAKNRVVDAHASQLAAGFRKPEFTAVNKIYPIVDVSTESGKFMQFAADAFVIQQNLERALGDDRKRIEMRVGSGSYNTAEVSVEVPVYDREIKNVPEQRRQDYRDKKTELAQARQLLLMEYTAAQILKDPAKYDAANTAALTAGNQWKETTSTPYANLRSWLRTISFKLGLPVSELSVAFAPKPWESLQDHAHTQDRIKYTGKEPSQALIAGILGCKAAELLAGMYATSFNPDDPTDVTFANIFDDEVLVYHEVANPSVAEPLWGGIARMEGYPIVTEYRDEPKSADIIACDENWGVFQLSNKRGFLARTVSGL